MAVIGTFGSFTAARMGIYASQAALNVTGNNIANINTTGYTRQRMDLVSLHSGGSDRYAGNFNVNIGYGVLTQGVNQLRDPYLDIRFRNEQASVGAAGAKLNGLGELSAILDEVGKGNEGFGVIEAQLNDFLSQLGVLSGKVGSREYDTLVRSSATTLVQLFNSYAKDLSTIQSNQEAALKQNINEVNGILESIRGLNEEIRKASIHGDKALELRDHRNNFIDQLAASMKVDVTYTTERIDQHTEVEKLVISLADTNPPIKLVDGIYGTQVSIAQVPQPNPGYDSSDPLSGQYLRADGTETNDASEANLVNNDRYQLELAPMTDSKGRYQKDAAGNNMTASTLVGDTTLYGSLQSIRELLTREGEFSSAADLALDKNANVKRGIPYYQKALDALAQKFAAAFNGANQIDPDLTYEMNASNQFVDKDGNVIEVSVGVPMTAANADAGILRKQGVLKPEYEFYNGGVLFSNKGDGDDPAGITAANISIAKGWATDEVRVLRTKEPMANGVENSTKNDNVNHMITLMSTKLDYLATDIEPTSASGKYFNGTFQEMLTSMAGTLATDKQTTTALYGNYSASVLSLDNERSSVSGVDLNEEATSMMQYQKSYAAACRLLTTVDAMLDKLINGTAL